MDWRPARIRQRLSAEDGQTMSEYALILVLVAIALMTAIAFFSGGLSSLFSGISSTLSSVAAAV